jgi:PhoH-like ATPase
MAKKKIYVLDTSVFLTDSSSVYSYKNNDIVVPLKVLEEIDKHKKRQDLVGANARRSIKMFDDLRAKGSLQDGVRLAKGRGMLTVRSAGPITELLPEEYVPGDPDNQIISTALHTKQIHEDRTVTLVSRDINMRVKSDALGLKSEDYTMGKVVKQASEIFTGFKTHLVDDEVIERFYNGDRITLDPDEIALAPNQFIMLVSNSNDKRTALARFFDYNTPLKRIYGDWKHGVWGVEPRNKEQQFAFELLMDPCVEIVSLVGKAGSGKTLCALAAGLQQLSVPLAVKGNSGRQALRQNEGQIYNRLIVTRPVQPLGKDLGFLPGTMEEKMAPWLMPIQDNLQYLLGDEKATLEMYTENGAIEVEALTYIRGRSIANAFLIVDEAQNLTKHELKTIITRVGEGTKIILTGDIEQIDSAYVDETTNGLTYAVESFKEYDITGHVTLTKGERSKVATLAAKVL